MDESLLHGLTLHHIDEEYGVHKEALPAFLELKQRAEQDGIELSIASSFRDFTRQKTIWNEKFTGKRTVLDSNSNPINIHDLSNKEKVKAILIWSALPGFSRHHWGTEIDVYDKSALAEGQQFELIPSEYEKAGPFEKLGDWLNEEKNLGDFIRPYFPPTNKISPEPWHLSFKPVSEVFQQQLSIESVIDFYQNNEIEGKLEIISMAREIYQNYIRL